MEVSASIAEPSDSLAMAMMISSHSPVILLDGDLRVIVASLSFCRAFKLDPGSTSGRAFLELGHGEWKVPQLESLLHAAIAGQAELIDEYEMDLKRSGREPRRLILNVRKLVYADKANIRLMVAITDVTDARFDQKFTESIVREKTLLLNELQNRVANSLQIIASVLMQSARRVASDETRGHLYNAHQRLMSVASLQHHLAITRLGDVEMRAYLGDLCKSIAASMIQNEDHLSLEVQAKQSVAAAGPSMSMGLIVTELVINAIKHAFPDRRSGKIIVRYEAHGPAWTLSVGDDGVGMPSTPECAIAGLGSSLVHALAMQLDAEIAVEDANPGTIVSITHQLGVRAEGEHSLAAV